MFDRRQFCLAASFTALTAPAFAQTYPAQPIKLIVPYAAGGGTDALARIIAKAMGEKLGQSMIVENIATGGGNVATTQAATARPDGYTVLMANQGPMTVNPHMMKSLKVDPLTAFAPVVQIASAPLVLIVPQNSPYKTFNDLIEAARKQPGKLNYGSAGNGSASHVATLLLNNVAKIDTVHVPYRGAGPAISDLMGSQTTFMITTIPSVIGLIEGQKVSALAVTSQERTPLLKDVATIAEQGLKGYEASAWYGLVVPAGTPSAVIDALRTACTQSLSSPEIIARLSAEGATPVGGSSEKFGTFIADEYKRWKDIVVGANLQVE